MTVKEMLIKHSSFCRTGCLEKSDECLTCPGIKIILSNIQAMLPKAKGNDDLHLTVNYQVGYNHALAEMNKALGMEKGGKNE